jgi:hypothetical protein
LKLATERHWLEVRPDELGNYLLLPAN